MARDMTSGSPAADETIGTPLTFVVVGGTAGGNASILNMTPPVATINVLAGGTTMTNLAVSNSSTTDTGAFTGAFTGPSAGASAVITGSPVSNATPGNVAITYAAQATPLAAPVQFAYTITNTSNTSDAQGAGANKVTNFSVNVGAATADNSNSNTTFGPALTGVVNANGSYAGLESMVVGTTGTGGAGSALGAGTAQILAGTNTTTSSQTVSMQWRTQTTAEKAATQYDPSLLKPSTGLISDVVNLTGLETTAGSPPTAPFVLEMAYNPLLTPKGGTVESTLIANKLIYLISLNPTTGLWDRSVSENTDNTVTSTDPSYGVNESFDDFLTNTFGAGTTTSTVTSAQLATVMGAWGVDTNASNHLVWAVLDHNSQFAVVPEPSTIILAAFGLLGLIGLRRRSKAVA